MRLRPPAILSTLLLAAGALAGIAPAAPTFHVATSGNDAWSGTLAAPNPQGTDGPLASIRRARDAVRQYKAREGKLKEAVRIQVHGGTYYLAETLTLGPEDSGTAECPVVYEAFPGERPVLSGGQKIAGEQPSKDSIQTVRLPEVAAGKWHFRSLFAGGRRLVRARCPNVDPSDPYRRGFFYADRDANAFGYAVGSIHNPGDWMEYKIQVPADGSYAFWVYYGSANAAWGTKDMAGRTAIRVDDGPQIPLMDLPDTGGWDAFRWSRSATVQLTKGEHRLRWQNLKGGGINLEAYALSDDPDWKPQGTTIPKPAAGRHAWVLQAENFVEAHGPQLAVSGGQGSPTEFHFAPGHFKSSWAAVPEAEVHIFQSSNCRAFKEIVSIAKVDEASRTVTVVGKECGSGLRPGDRYFVENLPDELDAPGEWHLNRQTGELRYWLPEAVPQSSPAVAPRLGRLVELLGDARQGKPVSHVRLAGLTFQETDYSPEDGCAGYGMGNDGVVYLKDATGCAIENCTFRQIGKYGVCLSGGSENSVRGNDLFDSAEGGVLLLNSARNTVRDNHIHHLGAVYKHIGGVILEGPGTDDNHVDHNLVHHSSRYGISLKNPGSRNHVEFNRILNTNLETFDTGGIEVTQGDKAFISHSVIRGNVVGDTIGYSSDGPKPVFLSWGIYLDSYAGGYTVTHNVVYRNAHGGLMLQGGRENHVVNNVFVGGKFNQMHITNFDNNATGLVLERNIFAYTDPAAALLSGGHLTPAILRADRNLYFHAGGKDLVFRGGAASFADWQRRGFDQHSLVADPRFVDPQRDDYSLRPDSPALKLGFEPIDSSKAGLLRARCRCEIRPAGPDYGL